MSDKTVTKEDIARAISDKTPFGKIVSARMTDAVFCIIKAYLKKGYEVKISGFGKFSLTEKKPRQGRDPRTGALVAVPARRSVSFRFSGSLLKKF